LSKQRGADIIVEHLVHEGVPYVFGLCGHGNVGFLDAAHKASDRIKTISVHHEQTAGYMADAYYKVRHEPVATFTSSGPGSCNLVISLANAMADSSAFLAITGNVPTDQFNRGPFQETGAYYQADFPGVIRSYVKRSFQPTRAEMIPLAMAQSFGLLRTGRPGPVNVDVPFNVFLEEAEYEPADVRPQVSQRSPGDTTLLRKALDLLLRAERPLIIAGQGALLSEASAELTAFAERLGVPVTTSPNGKGAIDETHRLALGAMGRNGTHQATEAAKNADVILAIGFSFDDRATSSWLPGYSLSIPPTKLIQIDADPTEIGKNYPVTLGILADARASLAVLNDLAAPRDDLRSPAREQWLARLGEAKRVWDVYQEPFGHADQVPLRPERLMKGLERVFPERGVLATDVGVHHNWVVQLWKTRRPRALLQSWGFAAMGYATSGILGAKLAAPDHPAVALVGDGSFLMTPHVLATAVEYDIPVVWVVWNNYGYGSIRDLQLGFFEQRELATSFQKDATGELYNPDFAARAKSFGVESATVQRSADLEEVLDVAIKAGRPYLVEVPVDRDIKPVGTGSWAFPPLEPSKPNFVDKARAAGLL
jgi:acetolactate synthase I/II/III large subunit